LFGRPSRKESTIGQTQNTYLPAAGHDRALPLYDPLVKLLGIDAARMTLLDRAALQPSLHVLDIGCGTGTLAILLKRLHPGIDVVGLDPDPKALARASRKAKRAAASIRFDRGFSQNLPYPDASFDRVLSSFMLHHLDPDDKRAALREVRRVLKPGGLFHLLDFGGNATQGRHARIFHSTRRLKDNSDSQILKLLSDAGFVSPNNVMNGAVLLGLLRTSYYEASAPC
jgi:ubiquinone/menaquinone biosynthesis C-methylase UbiE